jgi:hypothetical protein
MTTAEHLRAQLAQIAIDAQHMGHPSPFSHSSHPSPWPPRPPWAVELRQHALPTETTLPETIERLIGPFASDPFKLWYSQTFGIYQPHCNCAALRAQWAVEFSYAAIRPISPISHIPG